MQNNYYFLRQLSRQLEVLLKGSQLQECYSQSKGELSLCFRQPDGTEVYLKGVLLPDFSCLYLPKNQQRARRNSVDLFPELLEQAVMAVEQYRNDRSFSLRFEGGYSLLFKMHGNRSNVLLLHQQEPIRLFKNKLAKDWNLSPDALHRKLNFTHEAFLAAGENPSKVLPILGQEAMAYLQAEGWETLDSDAKWQRLQAMVQQLENPQTYYVSLQDGKPHLLLFEWGESIFSSPDPLAALNYFYRSYTHDWALQREKSSLIQQLDRRIRNTESYLYKTMEKLEELQTSASHRHLGDLLMANLHAIPTGSEKAEVLDFYTGQPVTIKLKRELSPQKNAEQFYRKAKNQQLELKHLEDNITAKEERLTALQALRQQVSTEEDLKQLRRLRKEQLPEDENQPSLPYRLFEVQQHQILVGKGAAQNDELLRYHSRKDDLWLHAKDVSGSHVIIRRQPGKPVPAPVKQKAAQLAAWYSKRKSDSLCPVICTPRKWVRKVKGAPAGAVLVDKEEEVLLVEPRAYE